MKDLNRDYKNKKISLNKKNYILEINLLYKTEESNKRALIWIPGFNDFYYHLYVGNKLLESGIDLWVINFNNFGPSLKNNHDNSFNTNNFSDFIDQVKKTIEIINIEKTYDKKYLYGHSLGGLIALMYCNENKNTDIQGLILNSPLLMYTQYNIGITIILLYILQVLGSIPIINKFNIKTTINTEYSSLISKYNYLDENMYRKNIYINMHMIKMLIKQCNLIREKKINIEIPILIMYSNKMSTDLKKQHGEHILNIKDIEYYSKYIGSNVDIHSINGALHDVLAFSHEISDVCLNIIFEWINKYSLK